MQAGSQEQERPLLFISHKHSDSTIASSIKDWVERWSMGAVNVYLSSSSGNAPQVGANLNQELMDALFEAQVVTLIYTNSDQDWSYCMWEAGIATDPKKVDTKVIVFQCTKDVPSPFQNRVRVNTHSRTDVEKFVRQFLTEKDFFPHYERAVCKHLLAESPQVSEAAEDLYTRLDAVTPSEDPSPTERWPSLAFLQLCLNLNEVEEITAGEPENRTEISQEIFLTKSTVSNSDNVAAGIFGMPNLRKGMFLREVINNWKERGNSKDEGWITLLINQLTSAACWRFPKIEWKLLKGADGKWYAPILNWVEKQPTTNLMYFEVHFIPFTISEGDKTFEITVPQD